MLQAEEKYISPEEYLSMEASAGNKNEYYHGEIFAMTGASVHHNIISMNTAAALHHALRNSDCIVFSGDIKVQVAESLHYTYPDISIVCGDIEYGMEREDVIVNPVTIIEVLSKSTADYDKGLKFTAYRNMPSLKDYILIDQYSCHVEYFRKMGKNQWWLHEFKNPEDRFRVESVQVELSLKEIYFRIGF